VLGLGRDALGLGFSSSEGLPIRLRTASRTLARPFDSILRLSAAMMLMTSFGALPFSRNLDLRGSLLDLGAEQLTQGFGIFVAHSRTFSKPKRYPLFSTGKEDDMTRLLAITVTALAMGLVPAMATENSSPPTQPPTANTVSPEASKSATVPPSGSADTSGGATEQSSSPPSAGSTMGKMGEKSSSSPSAPSTSGKMGETPNPTAPGSND
jgi:hypothetical protein